MKKIITAAICLVILISSMGFVTSKNIEFSKDDTTVDDEETSSLSKFTIYRVSPDGEISPVDIYLENVGEDIGAALENVCSNLFENDEEIQRYLGLLENNTGNDTNNTQNTTQDSNNTGLNLSLALGMVRIKSHGRGFHFKTKTKVQILTKFKFFKIMLPRIRISARKPIVFCKYPADERAKTTYHSIIKSYLNENATQTEITGNHSVFVKNFIGYTTWFGRISNPFSSLIPRAFSGIGKYVICNQL